MDRAQVRAGDGSRANLRPRLTSSKATIVLSVQRFPQVARSSGVRFNGTMRGRAILILLGLTAFGAYSGGRQGVPISNAPVAAATSPSVSVKPVAFIASAAQVPAPVASSGPASAPKADSPERAAAPCTKGRGRADYRRHGGGHRSSQPRSVPCPGENMRNGRACGGRSAYSRPGGAAPRCYSGDVTAAVIESYKQQVLR
jgi:hypothetical protein